MDDLLYLVPALPLAAFVALVMFGGRLPRQVVSLLGVLPTGGAAVVALGIAGQFLTAPPRGGMARQVLWNWLSVGSLQVDVGFYLDPLAVVMIATITVVAFFILLYATEYMHGDDGYSRFFAYMNLFVASMLVLVLADNLLLLYLGWEGVGLCSYLLIGFWYRDLVNVRAARKAFLVTRIGDTALAVGIFLLLTQLGTLNIQDLQSSAKSLWAPSSPVALLAAALVLGGAVGKSAQLPLQTWLLDAMAGPTPVSALIHAATMVTAGFYLIARLHVLFTIAPEVQWAVGIIGGATLLLAAFAALTQTDIKRVLAYSTMSQVGYMFLALGVGAASAATFHFMTHAFFKSLLFLAAGSVILAMGHSNDMLRMGGLRRRLPLVYWTFLAGAAALAALPLVSGFFSKEAILLAAWERGRGGQILWGVGVFGAFLTAVYTFRMVFLVFHGREQTLVTHRPTWAAKLPLVVLALLSLVGGYVQMPATVPNAQWFSAFVDQSFDRYLPFTPAMTLPHQPAVGTEWTLQLITLGAVLAGLVVARQAVLRKRKDMRLPETAVGRYWRSGWGFDRLYDALLVQPISLLARANRRDVVDLLFRAIGRGGLLASAALARTQTGRVRWYAAALAVGVVLTLILVVLS